MSSYVKIFKHLKKLGEGRKHDITKLLIDEFGNRSNALSALVIMQGQHLIDHKRNIDIDTGELLTALVEITPIGIKYLDDKASIKRANISLWISLLAVTVALLSLLKEYDFI